MGYWSKLKKRLTKKTEGNEGREPAMNESDNPLAKEAATSFAELIKSGKKRQKKKDKPEGY